MFDKNLFSVLKVVEASYVNPCSPSPCGPNSQCREINSQAVCSCKPSHLGSPPYCRPECVVSSECPRDKACMNQKCINPCIGTCGKNSECQVINHSPICSCQSGYTGDPFLVCSPIPSKQFFDFFPTPRVVLIVGSVSIPADPWYFWLLDWLDKNGKRRLVKMGHVVARSIQNTEFI